MAMSLQEEIVQLKDQFKVTDRFGSYLATESRLSVVHTRALELRGKIKSNYRLSIEM